MLIEFNKVDLKYNFDRVELDGILLNLENKL